MPRCRVVANGSRRMSTEHPWYEVEVDSEHIWNRGFRVVVAGKDAHVDRPQEFRNSCCPL